MRDMSQEKRILVCEDSMEGIFTAVYDGWKECTGDRKVLVQTSFPLSMELFASYREIDTDRAKAGKVMRTILMKLGSEAYEQICLAAVGADPDRGTAIYYVLRRALGRGRCESRVMEALADPYVARVAKLALRVKREYHHYFGFVRFREISGMFLLAQIQPENDILPLLAPHFSNRFPNENWVIYDERRQKALCHGKGQECVIRKDVHIQSPGNVLGERGEYEELWQAFCHSVSIEARQNETLQKQMLPLRFRNNMPEFAAKG